MQYVYGVITVVNNTAVIHAHDVVDVVNVVTYSILPEDIKGLMSSISYGKTSCFNTDGYNEITYLNGLIQMVIMR